MNSNSRSRPILLAPVLVVVGLAVADPAAGQVNPLGGALIPVPFPEPGGVYTSIVTGDLDGNLSLEVAAIETGASNALIIFHNPDATEDSILVAIGALDVCYYPIPDDEGRPRLLFTTDSDVKIATFVDDHYEVSSFPHPAAMEGATRLRFGTDLDGDHVFFVGSDGHSIHATTAQANALSAEQLLGTLAHAVLDLVPLDFNGDGFLDFGLLHGNGIQVRSGSWVLYLIRSRLVLGDAITSVQVAEVGECFVWATRLAGDQTKVYVFSPALPSPYFIDFDFSETYGSATAADVDADGLQDIVLGRTESRIDVLVQQGPTLFEVWDKSPIEMSPEGTPLPMGAVVCGNLLNDRNDDGAILPGYAAILPTLESLRLTYAPDSRLAATLGNPDFERVRYRSPLHSEDEFNTTCPFTSSAPARWTTNLGYGWGTTSANAIELIVRRQIGNLMVNAALHHQRCWLPSEGQIDDFPVDFFTTSFNIDNPADKYFVVVRPIHVSGSPDPGQTFVPEDATTETAWRWSILSMSGNCVALRSLRNLSGALLPEVPICSVVSCTPFSCPEEGVDLSLCVSGVAPPAGPSTRIIPSAVPQSRVPSSGPGVLPIINPPNY